MKPKHHRFSAMFIYDAVMLVRSGSTYRQAAASMDAPVTHKTVFEWVQKFKGAKLTQLKKSFK